MKENGKWKRKLKGEQKEKSANLYTSSKSKIQSPSMHQIILQASKIQILNDNIAKSEINTNRNIVYASIVYDHRSTALIPFFF